MRKIPIFIIVLLTFFNCSRYREYNLVLEPIQTEAIVLQIKPLKQQQDFDCGQTALAMVMNYWGAPDTSEQILYTIFHDRPANYGVTAGDLATYAKERNFHAFTLAMTREEIIEQIDKGRPVIVSRRITSSLVHFLVVIGYDPNSEEIIIANPEGKVVACTYKTFGKILAKTEQFTLLVVPR